MVSSILIRDLEDPSHFGADESFMSLSNYRISPLLFDGTRHFPHDHRLSRPRRLVHYAHSPVGEKAGKSDLSRTETRHVRDE